MDEQFYIKAGGLVLVAVVIIIYLYYYNSSYSGFKPAAGGHNGYTVKMYRTVPGRPDLEQHSQKDLWFYTFGNEPKWYLFDTNPLSLPPAALKALTPLASGSFSGPLGQETYTVATGQGNVAPDLPAFRTVVGSAFIHTDPDGYKRNAISWKAGEMRSQYQLM